MQFVKPVPIRLNLNQELVELLRERILNGELAPGDRLNEVHLSKRFGVSRTPLREALIVLAHEGFLSNEPRRGFFVDPLTVDEVMSIYPIRATLDPLALKIAGIPAEQRMTELQALNKDIAASVGDPAQTIDLDVAWHIALTADCPNLILLDIIRQITLRKRRYEYAYMRERSNVHIAVEEHESILSALEVGDLPRACDLLRINMETAQEPLVAWLKGTGRR